MKRSPTKSSESPAVDRKIAQRGEELVRELLDWDSFLARVTELRMLGSTQAALAFINTRISALQSELNRAVIGRWLSISPAIEEFIKKNEPTPAVQREIDYQLERLHAMAAEIRRQHGERLRDDAQRALKSFRRRDP